MEITYRIDKLERVVYITQVGHITYEFWEQAMLKILADLDFERGYNFLSDRRRVTHVPSPEEARATAEFFKAHEEQFGRCFWAGVVNETAAYGMTRMLSLLADASGVIVDGFTDFDKGRNWLLDQSKVAE